MEKIKEMFYYYKWTSSILTLTVITNIYMIIFIRSFSQIMWLNIIMLPIALISFVKEYALNTYDKDTKEFNNFNLLFILLVCAYMAFISFFGYQAFSLY